MLMDDKIIFDRYYCINSAETKETRIVRESDYSPASQLFLQGEKNNDR